MDTFAIAGYSLGSPVAVRAATRHPPPATRHPDRVTGLVLTAGFAHPHPRFLLAARFWRDPLRSGDLDLDHVTDSRRSPAAGKAAPADTE